MTEVDATYSKFVAHDDEPTRAERLNGLEWRGSVTLHISKGSVWRSKSNTMADWGAWKDVNGSDLDITFSAERSNGQIQYWVGDTKFRREDFMSVKPECAGDSATINLNVIPSRELDDR